MFGDDPDTTVTTARVGSGTDFGRAREGSKSWQEGLGGQGQEGSENPIGLERSTQARRAEGR